MLKSAKLNFTKMEENNDAGFSISKKSNEIESDSEEWQTIEEESEFEELLECQEEVFI